MAGQRARDLEAAYSQCLKKQIIDQGSSLPCKDQNFFNEVEELLKNNSGHDAHCLGLDTFDIMEESLRSAAESKRVIKVRGGLSGLAKAFEVLEQAALNLYLGPWREEYKVVKMYSGVFTHCIKPVFSTYQIDLLFGLLGYKKCSTQREQLSLQPQKISAARMEKLLRLSCAFFLGRCECRLLLAALGKYAGQPQRELSIVKERQRGHNLENALDNTLRQIDVKQSLKELPEESDMDLYTDEQKDEQLGEMAVDEPRSLTWTPNKSANGVHREPNYISTHHQKFEAQSSVTDFSSLSTFGNRRETTEVSGIYNETSRVKKEPLPVSLGEKPEHEFSCECLKGKTLCLRMCKDCQTCHDITCSNLEFCRRNHSLEFVEDDSKHLFPGGAVASLQKGNISPNLNQSSGALSSLTLQEKSEGFRSGNGPLAMHNCCELSGNDPQVVCWTCQMFHINYCNEAKDCLSSHEAKRLGLCSTEKCSQKSLVMCKYCVNECCKDCWYKNPIHCSCGQTFDFSSAV